jgi:hypothetical protein
MHGFVSAKRKVHTLKDLREFVAWCDKYKVDGDCNVDYGTGGDMYIDLISGLDVLPASWIECGDHMWDDIHYDVLIETHKHPADDPQQPALYDWPAKDRLKQAYKQAPDTYEEALEQGYDRYAAEGRPE